MESNFLKNWSQSVHKLLRGYGISACLLSIILCGCATTMEIKPNVTSIQNSDFYLKGKIIFEGNAEYLPRLIVGAESNSISSLAFRYVYTANYEKQDVSDGLAFINPLTLFGFPTGSNQLTLVGTLDVLIGNEVKKSYIANCHLKKTRSIYSEESLSEMRKKGLIEIRNNIESQMYLDKAFLENLQYPRSTSKG